MNIKPYFIFLFASSLIAQTKVSDFVDYQKYDSENKMIMLESNFQGKTVLMGDSITEF